MRSGRGRRSLRLPAGGPSGLRGSFHTDPATLATHAVAAGPFRITPAAVAVPAVAEDVGLLVAWAARERIPVLPRGAATGMPGGNVGPGLALDLRAELGWIEPPDRERGTLRCGAGAIAGDVARAAATAGLMLPCLPSSAERCTIGGMIANNAAGARSFRHGATRAWIESLDVVWADGTRGTVGPGLPTPAFLADLAAELRITVADTVRTRWPHVRKNSSGYALDRFLPDADGVQLLAGSEGTLGIVVGATLRLTELPVARAVALLALPEIEAIPRWARFAGTVQASTCEMFGRRLVEMAGSSLAGVLPEAAGEAEALVLVELAGDADAVADGLARVRSACRAEGTSSTVATDAEGMAHLWEVRHAASPLVARAAEHGRRSTQFIEDSVVPVERVPDYLRGVEEILRGAGTEAVVFGHAGDGNVHVNPLVDVRTPAWRDRVRIILEETVELVAGLGGTLSGEHGDGRVRAPFLERIWGSELAAAFRTVKRRLDPGGILNPGVILPLADQDPLAGLWPDA